MDVEATVVGAGAAGVAAAARLSTAGIETVVLEEARPARSWWSRYEGLHLNTVRWMSDLPGYRMGRRHGPWPSRVEWADYITRFADEHRLQLRKATQVQRIERADDRWRVIASDGAIHCRFVIVATGHDRTPNTPEWPGLDSYGGRFLHSADYRSADDFRDQDVLVVGAGNTGTEIATQLSQARARRVRLSVRTPPLIFPRTFGGISITAWGALAALFPDFVLDRSSKMMQRIAFGNLSAFGLRGDHRPVSRMRYEYYAPVVESGFVDALKQSDIEVVAAVRGFDREAVVLEDESRIRCDAVIAATGHVPGLEALVGHLGVLDRTGEPMARGGYSPRGSAGLFFAGFRAGFVALLPYLELDAREITKTILRARNGRPIPELFESQPVSGPQNRFRTLAVLGHALSTRLADIARGRHG